MTGFLYIVVNILTLIGHRLKVLWGRSQGGGGAGGGASKSASLAAVPGLPDG